MHTFLGQTYEVLTRPLTAKEAVKAADENGYIEGVIQVKLSDLVNNDYENFLDVISNALFDGPYLSDLQYEIVGCDRQDIVLLLVSGQIDHELIDNINKYFWIAFQSNTPNRNLRLDTDIRLFVPSGITKEQAEVLKRAFDDCAEDWDQQNDGDFSEFDCYNAIGEAFGTIGVQYEYPIIDYTIYI
jgi:hypothetical protein